MNNYTMNKKQKKAFERLLNALADCETANVRLVISDSPNPTLVAYDAEKNQHAPIYTYWENKRMRRDDLDAGYIDLQPVYLPCKEEFLNYEDNYILPVGSVISLVSDAGIAVFLKNSDFIDMI